MCAYILSFIFTKVIIYFAEDHGRVCTFGEWDIGHGLMDCVQVETESPANPASITFLLDESSTDFTLNDELLLSKLKDNYPYLLMTAISGRKIPSLQNLCMAKLATDPDRRDIADILQQRISGYMTDSRMAKQPFSDPWPVLTSKGSRTELRRLGYGRFAPYLKRIERR